MTTIPHRKPVRNFFVKRPLQLRLILKIVLIVLITTCVSLFSVLAIYYVQYKTVLVYQLDKITQNLDHKNIVDLLLPALLCSAIVNLLLAIAIGFYASRKYAIPIYKLEQWASLLMQGKFTAHLHFREKEEFRELTHQCNELTADLRRRFLFVKQQVEFLRREYPDLKMLKEIEVELAGLEITSDPIAVNTGFFQKVLKEQQQH